MKIEKRIELALKISESIENGKICPNNLYDLQLHLSNALEQVKNLALTDVIHWVAVNDELALRGTYLTWNGEKIVVCEFDPIHRQFIGNTANGVKDDITHWQKLPKPPCV